MTEYEDQMNCGVPEPHARRITLKDGRYMIFFEFGDAEPDADAAGEEETPDV